MAEPVVTQKEPYGIEVKEGAEFWWCACGKSGNQPFCDGSHRGTDFSPVQFIAKRDQTVWFCGCKKSSSQPTCDGTHNHL